MIVWIQRTVDYALTAVFINTEVLTRVQKWISLDSLLFSGQSVF